MRANIIDICLQGKQVYAEKRLERIKAAKEKSMKMQLSDSILSNGAAIANGHANGYTNGVTKRKAQWIFLWESLLIENQTIHDARDAR